MEIRKKSRKGGNKSKNKNKEKNNKGNDNTNDSDDEEEEDENDLGIGLDFDADALDALNDMDETQNREEKGEERYGKKKIRRVVK